MVWSGLLWVEEMRSGRSILHCAIYTRKSSDEGLEQGFNSLDAQREACEAYIKSQHHEGWRVLPALYDDGGYSGGNMERPALLRLLEDIDKRRVQVVVVYKVDRLTRALADFAKIVERFDASGISFVSVTQQFNTTSSMGRLTLNVLLSFAQFEREVTGERIRDKIAASKQKGMWMGGRPPIGYVADGRTLAIEEEGAGIIRHIYQRYQSLGCVRKLQLELHSAKIKTPRRLTLAGTPYGGLSFSRGHLYKILRNPVYLGQIVHLDKVYAGQHPAIIDEVQWQAVQTQLDAHRQQHQQRVDSPSDSLLKGLMFDEQGQRLIPSHSRKKSKRYRYYVTEGLITGTRDDAPLGLRLPAQEIESIVIAEMIRWLNQPAVLLEYAGHDSVSAHQLLGHAEQTILHLSRGGESCYKAIRQLIRRIEVWSGAVKIQFSPLAILGETSINELDSSVQELEIPARLKRCGMAMRLVLANQEAQTRNTFDVGLVQRIAKAHEWFSRLISGAYASVNDLAVVEGVSAPYVTRIMYSAFLAPDIVEAILAGKQPPGLTLEKLKNCLPLPIDWNEQRKLLGFLS